MMFDPTPSNNMLLASYRRMLMPTLRIVVLLFFFLLSIDCLLLSTAEATVLTNRDAIVKIFTVKNQPDYYRPWSMKAPKNINGSGCIIEGERILTNAHVVANSTFLQVRRYGQSKKFMARILNISHEADLALLTVDDKDFFKKSVPIKLGVLPKARQKVFVYGFPIGGNSLSITEGILSRIEHQYYAHSGSLLLAGQIDAAINPGNSGGPVLVDGRLIGVVMQSHADKRSENIGYMSTISVIQHFFNDIKDGRYDGFPNIGLVTQKMENPVLKEKYKLKKSQTGLLVNHILQDASAKSKIKPGDVLLSIDNQPIADDGTVEFREKNRTSYTYYIDKRQIGDSIGLKILREGVVKSISLKLEHTENQLLLVPNLQYDRLPRYFIYGGFVFTPLTLNYVQLWGSKWKSKAPKEMVIESTNWPTEKKKEVVFILRTLADKINTGYFGLHSWIVRDVNGRKFKDFNEFYQIVTTSTDPFIVLRNGKKYEVIIDRKQAVENHQGILKTYRISKDRSPDLRLLPSKQYLF